MHFLKVGVVALVGLGLVASANAQFGGIGSKLKGLGGGGGDKGGGGKVPDIGQMQAELDKSVLEIGLARKYLLEAQIKLAEALGKKTEADQILSTCKIMGEGAVVRQLKSADDIDESAKPSKPLNEIIAQGASNAAPLSAEAAEIFKQGKIEFSKGLLAEAGQIAIVVKLSMEIKDAAEKVKGNPINMAKIAAMAPPAVKLASLIPGDVTEMAKTWQVIRQVGSKNNIEVEEVDVSKYLNGPAS